MIQLRSNGDHKDDRLEIASLKIASLKIVSIKIVRLKLRIDRQPIDIRYDPLSRTIQIDSKTI